MEIMFCLFVIIIKKRLQLLKIFFDIIILAYVLLRRAIEVRVYVSNSSFLSPEELFPVSLDFEPAAIMPWGNYIV